MHYVCILKNMYIVHKYLSTYRVRRGEVYCHVSVIWFLSWWNSDPFWVIMSINLIKRNNCKKYTISLIIIIVGNDWYFGIGDNFDGFPSPKTICGKNTRRKSIDDSSCADSKNCSSSLSCLMLLQPKKEPGSPPGQLEMDLVLTEN